MIKFELVHRLAEQNERGCEAVVNVILSRIADTLAAGD